MTAEKVDALVKGGCPVRAAEVLLASRQPRTRSLLSSLERGMWSLPLPATSPIRDALRARIERELPALSPRHGIYALSVQHVAGEVLGCVERLVPTSTPPVSADEFTRGAAAGAHRARDWLTRVWGPLQAISSNYFSLERIPPLPDRTEPATLRGDSAGLAAALATVWPLWPKDSYIAATGQVDADGRIMPVELVEAKLEGLRREAPFIDRVLVPWSEHFSQQTMRAGLEIIPVRTVDEALELVFGASRVKLVLMAPLDAAHEAVRLELAHEHDLASNYAIAAVHALDNLTLPEQEQALVRALGAAVEAINLTHEGQAKAAEHAFKQIAPVLSTRFRANPRAQIAAMRASQLIDILDFDGAIAACEQCASIVEAIDPLPEVMLRGSWARALAAAGRLDEARAQAHAQCSVTGLEQSLRNQLFRAYCNRIAVELKLHARGDTEALGCAATALEEAARNNMNASPTALEANRRYLEYWDARILCAEGRLDEAHRRVEELTNGRYPEHLLLRYLAAAYHRVDHGAVALELLERARMNVASDVKGFERITLLSSTPLESRLRRERSLPRCREPGGEFAALLDDWRPGFIRWPDGLVDDDAWIAALEDAVSRLPY